MKINFVLAEVVRWLRSGAPLILATSLTFTGRAAAPLDTNRIAAIAAHLPAVPLGLGRPIGDREAWQRLKKDAALAAQVGEAEKLARSPEPELPDELFLDFSRTGNRDRGQKVMFERGQRLTTFVLAECLENQGRFLTPLTNCIATLCAERTWVYPAHDRRLDNFNGRIVEMDLRATAVAWELAGADFVLGDKLPPETRALIRREVRRRVLDPFRDMANGRREEISWLRATHNWNAVCLAGVTGAALALEDSAADRAWFIAATEYYIQNFLKGFTPDGYCSEGLGYWNYGFGHFTMLAEAIRQTTGGAVDLLAGPAAAAPARFAVRAEVLDGIYPSIADCSPGARPEEKVIRYLSERFGWPLAGMREETLFRPTRSLVSSLLFAFLPEKLPLVPAAGGLADSALRTWFTNGGVLICRTAAQPEPRLAAVLKGGHNAEHHNHNDVGSFSVVTHGRMVLCDPGAEVYTARTFSAKRYDSKVLNSFGHAVPVIAGRLQRTGAEARAVVLRAEFNDQADTLALDLRSAYAVPELKKLDRTFTFRRSDATLTVQDAAAFTQPKTFETALITWGQWEKISDHELAVRDGDAMVKVTVDTGGQLWDVRSEILDEEVHARSQPTRIGIALKAPVEKAIITLTIAAAPGKLPEKK